MLASFLIGTQFILAFLTLVFYFRVKNKAYLYYAMHVFCIAGYAAFCCARVDEGFKDSFFIGPKDQYFHYLALFSTLSMISIINFIRCFLSLDVTLARWDNIMKYLSWLGIGIFLGALLGFSPLLKAHLLSPRLLEFYIFIVSLVGIAFILPLTQKIKSTNIYFVVGFCSLVAIATIAVILRYFGIPYFYYFVEAAVLIESVLFALALTEQQRLKDKEQSKAIIELEKTRNQQQLNQLENERIKELEEVRSSFYTNLTHEFRTPLTVIMGMAETIQSKHTTQDLQESSELILRNSKQVLNMINQLLEVAKSDTGNIKLDLQKGDIIHYIHYVSESFYAVASEKKIQLSFHAECDDLIIDFDAEKVKHVVQNILANAIKYTNPGGKILVLVKIENSDYLSIRFKDTGMGILEEDIPHIFERFYQAKNSSAGTGIGLALSKEFVELMNGSIEVESKIGWGTEMTIDLPIINQTSTPFLDLQSKSLLPSNKKEVQPILLHTDPPASSDRPLILLVEDNIGVITYVQALLQESYQIIIGINGKEGLDLALERIPDIIITDVMMAEMNGYELTNQLKQDIRTSHIPVIMLTAKADQQSRLSGLEVGADAYLNKPFERKELLLQISNLLTARKLLIEKYAGVMLHNISQPGKEGVLDHSLSPQEDEFISRVNKVIDDSIGKQPISVEQIALKIEISPNQLKRKLKALTNKTTKQYIKRRQIYAAQKLLSNSELGIAEIAYELGFSDSNYFVRVFKSELGMPPGAFRKELQVSNLN